MAAKGISGVGIGIMTAGAVIAWSGINNVSVIDALRAISRGQKIPSNRKPPFQPVNVAYEGGTATGNSASNNAVLAMAEQVAASPAGRSNYCWGGGHSSSPCSAKCFDCSGYVSCVFNRLGVMKGSKNTLAFMAWKGLVRVPWNQRQPGDLALNAGHVGIIIDDKTMWNAACTACGPVKKSSYAGKRYNAYRLRSSSTASGVIRGG